MKRIVQICGVCLISLLLSCGKKEEKQLIFLSDPVSQAKNMTSSYSPSEVAEQVILWMSDAQLSQRDYARVLTKEILSIYDSIGKDSGREFQNALEASRKRLSDEKLAHVYILATGPWRLGVVLRESNANSSLVEKVESEYASDSIALQYFRKAYNLSE